MKHHRILLEILHIRGSIFAHPRLPRFEEVHPGDHPGQASVPYGASCLHLIQASRGLARLYDYGLMTNYGLYIVANGLL